MAVDLMDADYFRELHAREPFQPFRVRLVTGRTYEVRQRDLLMVGRTSITVGRVDREHAGPIYDHLLTIALVNIRDVELIA
jgi:hypothetical protein